MEKFIHRRFPIIERGSSIKTEIAGGVTNFFTVLYILIINPALFMSIGMDFSGVFFATVASIVIGTVFMGLCGNYPVVVAPGLGINAYVVYTVIHSMGYSYQDALGACFVASFIFILLSLTSFRQALINSIPEVLKIGITAGIGLFVAFIGMKNGSLVVASKSTFVTMGDVYDPNFQITLAGLLVGYVLMIRGYKIAFLLGMIFSTILAWCMGILHLPESFILMPDSNIFSAVGVLEFSNLTNMLPIVATILLVTMFDTTGTIIGVGRQANIIKDGKFPNLKSTLMADAVASFFGSWLGTGPCSSFAESSAGVSAGARTGLASIVSAACFVLIVFMLPLASTLAAVPSITAPVLIFSGLNMLSEIRDLPWDDMLTSIAGLLTCIIMPLTYSITNGVAMGIFFYIALEIARGRGKKISLMLYVIAIWFLLNMLHII